MANGVALGDLISNPFLAASSHYSTRVKFFYDGWSILLCSSMLRYCLEENSNDIITTSHRADLRGFGNMKMTPGHTLCLPCDIADALCIKYTNRLNIYNTRR